MTTTTISLKVWVGCLACYNAGALTGGWYDAETADEITSAELHEAHDPSRHDLADETRGYGPHEELWVFDHEGFGPGFGEMSPTEAASLARDALEAERYCVPAEAYFAWREDPDVDTPERVGDCYRGAYVSVSDFAYYMVDSIGELPDTWLRAYIDWERVGEDLLMNDYEAHRIGGYLHVFSRY